MIWNGLILFCLAIGVIFNSLGILGLLRFPDVYTRLHAATKTTTFGSIFTGIAVILFGLDQLAETGDMFYLVLPLHALIAIIALALTNATGAHAIARAAHRSKVFPSPAVVDRLSEGTK